MLNVKSFALHNVRIFIFRLQNVRILMSFGLPNVRILNLYKFRADVA